MRLVSSDMHRVVINHGNAAVRSVCLTGDAFLVLLLGYAVSVDFDIQILISVWYVFGSWKFRSCRDLLWSEPPWISLNLETETVMVRSVSSFSTACDKGTTKL